MIREQPEFNEGVYSHVPNGGAVSNFLHAWKALSAPGLLLEARRRGANCVMRLSCVV